MIMVTKLKECSQKRYSWLTLLSRPFLRIILLLLTGLGLMAGLLFVYRFNPQETPLTPSCSFYGFTGLYCPACGMTRALHQAMHLRFGAAFSYNPLWPCIVLFMMVSLYLWLSYLVTGKNPFTPVNRFLRNHSAVGWIILITILSFWVLRNLPFYPFTLLAP